MATKSTTPTVASVMAMAEMLDTDNVRLLHTQLTQLYNRRMSQRAYAAAQTLAIGQRVQWTGRAGNTEVGTIESIGPKNSGVRTATTKWRVANTLLKQATENIHAASNERIADFLVASVKRRGR